jgi:hypothetical protein
VASTTPASKNRSDILLILQAHASNVKSPVKSAAFHREQAACILCFGRIPLRIGVRVLTALERGVPELAFQNIVLAESGSTGGETGLNGSAFSSAGRTTPAFWMAHVLQSLGRV